MPDESSALDQSCSRVFERRLLTFLLVEDYRDQQGSHAGSTDIHIFLSSTEAMLLLVSRLAPCKMYGMTMGIFLLT